MFNNKISRYIFIAAAFFYFVSWFSINDKTLQITGMSLPWISVFVSIPVALIMKGSNTDVDMKTENRAMGYVYAVATIAFSIAVLIMTHSFIPTIPHLACCACVIAASNLNNLK